MIAVLFLFTCVAALVTWTWYSKTRPSWAPLPNGYEFCRVDAYCCVSGSIDAPRLGFDGFAAPEHVARLAVIGDWVIGEVEYRELAPHSQSGQAGYFAVDTKNHERFLAMSETDWRAFLRDRAIADPPPMLIECRAYLRDHGQRGRPLIP